MSAKFTLLTAILMTLAALVWGFSLLTVVRMTGQWPLMNVMVSLTFAALAGIYWTLYFRRKTNTQPSGTE